MTSAVRSLLIVLGLLVAALGGVLTARPFTSVDVLVALVLAGLVAATVGQLLASRRPWTWPTRLSAITWLTAAIVIGTQPGIDLDTLAIVVGAALVLDGAFRVAEGIGGTASTQATQVANIAFGLAAVVLGVLLLATKDKTVLSVAVTFGPRLLWFGLATFWTGFRGTFDEAEPFQPGSPRRITTAAASAVALVLAVSAGSLSYWAHEGRPDSLGALQIPDEVPDEPGKLISFESFDRGVPGGARAWRILYTTTRDDGVPALSTGLVIASDDLPEGPRPVVAWAHGTTGIGRACAPSSSQTSAPFRAIPGFDKVLDEGWVIVATDYIGLGTPGPHPYLIGQGEGRSVLDAVRAAREFNKLDLSDRTVVWGHSQGGGAALWTAILAPTYAPDVDLLGVAGIAPASDLIGLVDNITRYPTGALFAAYVIEAYSRTYPDVDFDTYVNQNARPAMRAAAEVCVRDQDSLFDLAQNPAFYQGIYATSPTTGPLAERLRENTPSGRITVPTLIAQGLVDPLVLPSVQAEYVAKRCAASGNGPLDYRTYPGLEHTNIIGGASAMVPDLLSWTNDRFDGRAAPTSC